MGSSRGTSTTVVKNLPAYAESYVQNFLVRAQTLSNEAFLAYSATTYAAQNTDETDGIANLATRGRSGNLTISKAVAYVQSILDGDYLAGTQAEFLAALSDITGKPTSTFDTDIKPKLGGTLYLIGDLAKENIAKGLIAGTPAKYTGRTSTEVYYRNFETERGIQGYTLEHGPLYASQSAKDAELLRMAGLYVREYLQGSYEDAYKIWYENELGEVRRLEILGNAIRAMVGTQESTTEPYYRPSPVVGMVGGALSGAVAGFELSGGNPIGAVIGGALGTITGAIGSS